MSILKVKELEYKAEPCSSSLLSAHQLSSLNTAEGP